MRRFLCVFILLSITAFAQEGEEKEFPVAKPEQEAYSLLEQGRFVKARETAQSILNSNPRSFVALYIMGNVYEMEGSLPRARYFFEKARNYVEEPWGRRIPTSGPWRWHARILWGLIRIAGEMDRREEQIDLLRLHDELYQPAATARYGWPLMKLGRIEEGREMMASVVKSGTPEARLDALNTLGAMANEQDEIPRAYEIFRRLVDEAKKGKEPVAVAFIRNLAVTALTLQKYEEGEQLLLEATRNFQAGTFSNPWRDLARLYLSQGRFPEALGAVREMQAWSHRNLPGLDQQSWAERQSVCAALFDQCGYTSEAVNLMMRVMNRPDRRGGTSIHTDQSEAGTLVFYRHLLITRREQLAEEMSWCSWRDWFAKGLRRMADSAAIWESGNRAAALTVGNRRLTGSVRFTAPDSIDVLDWIRPDLNEILGAGVVGAEAERLLNDPDAKHAVEKPQLLLMLGESQLRRGLAGQARRTLELCAASLPRPEVLMRARAEALLASACERQGDAAAAMSHYQQAMQRDPGVIRTLGLALPARLESTGGETAQLAVSRLRKSPRFRNAPAGFVISVSNQECRLSAPDGSVLCRVSIAASKEALVAARSLCAEFHRKAFAAKVDLAQTDIASIEGSTLTGETIREQIKDLFKK